MAWTLTQNRRTTSNANLVWHVDHFSELTGYTLENLDQYSVPFTPNVQDQDPGITLKGPNGETVTRLSDFIRRYERQIPKDHIIVQMSKFEVMNNGYGKDIKLEDFPLVNAFLDNKITEANKTPLSASSYSFQDLTAKSVLVDNRKITLDDRILSAGFYSGRITLHTNSWFEDAYVHGTVAFALMDSTRFIVTTHDKQVDAEVGPLDDNFDYRSNSPTARLVNNLSFALGMGVRNNETIFLEYYGGGRKMNISR